MALSSAQSTTKGSGILLGGRIEIFPSQPLPELNATGGSAFAARLVSDPASGCFAIICASGLPPRIDLIQGLRTIDSASLLSFVEAGVVSWSDGSQVYAIVYQRPLMPRMMTSFDEIHPVMSEDAVNHHFITPMIKGLASLANSGIIHNAIRPTNIFWRIGTSTPPQIGECMSAPAGLGQPAMFEPIERAQAMPLGRGVGSYADDCYAFGVTLALLVLGRNPFQGMDDKAIIDLKMQRGSFAALVGTNRLSPTHIEILRGLLADDAIQRWTSADLELWLNGRRMTPKNSDAGKRAMRAFEFMGKEYWQIGPLVQAMGSNVGEAARIIENESLLKWLRRAMNDEERTMEVVSIIEQLKKSGKVVQYEDQLVARVCIALNPPAPIHYRGLSVMPMGIAPLLIDTALTGNHLAELSEIISTQLVSLWINSQKDHKSEYITLGQLFERLKNCVEKSSLGNGIERATYEANPNLACLSPMLRGQYVTTTKMLLPALEKTAGGGNRGREPLDRHIAAFLLVRDKRSDATFTPLTAPEGSVRRNAALLSIFSELQYRYGPPKAPQLAAWLGPLTEPMLRRFLSKTLREQAQKQTKDAIANGDLVLLSKIIDDNNRIERDRTDFIAARILYLNIQKEIVGLEAKLSDRESIVRSAGKPLAASISSFLAIILICAAVLRALAETFLR